MMLRKSLASLLLPGLLALGASASAQLPRINTLFPIGGKAGDTVEVEIRGSSLTGADKLIVHGQGVTGTVNPGGEKVDEANKPLWQNKCASCHELRSFANRSMTPGQWAATVDRMVKVRQAPLSSEEIAKVTQYLVSGARAGRITAQVKIEKDTLPGLYEMRVATPRGVSTVGMFEVGNLPEVLAVNNKREQALPITLPCVVNGTMAANGERHYVKFTAKKGLRYVFNLKAHRYTELAQEFFNPNLRLYDAEGKQIVENHGYYDLDPVIDWNCPADGEYVLEVRDLLGKGNPSSVYRLQMGQVPYDTVLFPPAASAGTQVTTALVGKNMTGMPTSFALATPATPGLTTVSTPVGPQELYVTQYPVIRDDHNKVASLPAGFAGQIMKDGTAETFTLTGNGRFEFVAYSHKLGSPAHLRVQLLDDKGRGIANLNTEGRNYSRETALNPDGRMNANLEAGKTYTLKVEETEGKGGSEYVYYIEARPGQGRLQGVVRPASVTLRPGMSTAVQVELNRREGVPGDVIVTAENLPPGVTAAPAIMQPDRNRAYLILTASANMAVVDQPINVYLSGKGPDGDIKAHAFPQEEYRIQNQPRYYNREECVAVVRGTPEFDVSLADNGPIRVHPRKGYALKVKIKRREGFKGGVVVRVEGLPSGWVANQEGAGPNQDEVTMTIRPSGENPQPYLKRDPTWTPIHAVVIAVADEYEFVVATPLVTKAEDADKEEKQPQ